MDWSSRNMCDFKRHKAENIEPVEDVAKTCNFFILHKKRYCRLQVARGYKLCGHHLIMDDSLNVSRYAI